jgi:L-threonylcarbamoyladenylate synthase
VRLIDAAQLPEAVAAAQGRPVISADALAEHAELAVWSRSDPSQSSPHLLHQRMPTDAAQAAQQLFATLRAFDALGVREIWIETPPATPEWDGVRDRLQRAAH